MTGQKYGVYSEFTSTEGGWLGDIPAHWFAYKLKFVANTFASNVDKKTKDGELPVQLCNYTDVYYNNVVSFGLPFMKATATREQIEKFTLRAGDTIITKDSEDPNDIAIPAFVEQDMPGVVCGYHLSIIRPTPIMSPSFLNKTFQCTFARAYFATRSNGLTRYGLGGRALGSVVLPVPPLEEQNQITKFLDYETAKIDALIETQQQLIALLKEKRQAIISHAVTKGLNPDAPMRDSGVEWLGEVPAHWKLKRLKHACSEIFLGLTSTVDYVEEGGVPLIRASDFTTGKLEFGNVRCISEAQHKFLTQRRRAMRGDVLLSKSGSIGTVALVDTDIEFSIYESVFVLRGRPGLLRSAYLMHLMDAESTRAQYSRNRVGMGVHHLNMGDFIDVEVPVPTEKEQEQIAAFINKQLQQFAKLTSLADQQAAMLSERRTALISAAVTGKIDVRNWQPPADESSHDEEVRHAGLEEAV